MFYEPGAVERELVAAGYEPRPSNGYFRIPLGQDQLIHTEKELEIRSREYRCLVIIRYRRYLQDGAKEQCALTSLATELGMVMTEAIAGYDGYSGYDDDTNSAFVECRTGVGEEEPLDKAIERLRRFAECLFGQIESAGRTIC